LSTQWIHRTKLLPNPLQPPARGIVPPDVAEYLGKSILNHGFEQDIDARCPSRYIPKQEEKPAAEAPVQTLIDIPAKGTPPATTAEELKPAKALPEKRGKAAVGAQDADVDEA
jgi:hypothetical protein